VFDASEEHSNSKIKFMNQNGSLEVIVVIRGGRYLLETAFVKY
jgi:hypothetical protein